MSLQSRLDIICDEAYGGVGPADDVSQEASDGISTDKPVSQLVLQLLRCVSCIFICICFLYDDSIARKLMFIVGISLCVLLSYPSKFARLVDQLHGSSMAPYISHAKTNL